MEDANAMAQHQMMLQQQQLMLLHQQYQQQQQQKQQHHQQQQQQQHHHHLQQQQQQSVISRFPSNIDAHLRTPGLLRSHLQVQQQQQHHHQQQQQQQQQHHHHQQHQQQQHHPHQQQSPQQQQKPSAAVRQGSQAEIEMAQQDAWRVCHPDVKRPFSSLEDACERLLPYHVVADYEAEEDGKLLDADPTGQMVSRSQQWDHNIAVKITEFTATFEKQVLAFNILTRKRAQGEIRLEERLMIEQALLQDEKQAYMEVRAEIESREKAGREAAEAKLRMAMAQAEQARAEMMAHGGTTCSEPVRVGSSSQGNAEESTSEIPGQEQGVNMEEILHGWGNVQREEEEPPEDFLNDDHEQNSENGLQEDWREVGELDLNTRK